MARAFEKLEDAFTTLIKVYERIQQFQQESKLANYIAEINSAQFRNQRSSEPMLNEAMERMGTQIQANVILGQYQLILNYLKMWAFPFAEFYLADFQIPERAIQTAETLDSNLDHSADTIRSLIETVSTKIDKIRAKVLDHKSTHKDIDNVIHTSKFIHSESTRPFYVWKYGEFGPLIRKLLAGKEVVLKADIAKAPQSYDAVKFNKIGLRLSERQEGTETGGRITPIKLKEELGHFHIKMTHMGNSYYKYGNQVFVIESKKIPFSFNFQEEVDGTPVTRNETYTKISKGNIVLSPFAMWKVKLKPADPERGFSKLISLSHLFKCDLELTGEGSYVSEGLENSLNLDNYYSNTVDATVTPSSTL